MKILVLSLLRLGDIIQQGPLLRGLRQAYPHAEIHLLMNQQFANVEEVLQGVVDKYVYLDRESLQRGVAEPGYNILWSYSQLETLVTSLSDEKYQIAFNFTHNKLSAYLLGALPIADKRGLSFEGHEFQGLENRWLKYFNDRFSGTQKSLFHYVELLGNAFTIPRSFEEPIKPRKKSKLILLQPLTSDKKKNWGLARYAELKLAIETSLVDYQVKVLGAAFEKEELLKCFPEEALYICGLSEVNSYLHGAALLVTGDTSIKHLAAQQNVPLVEIAIGSSDTNKTAAFSKNSAIVQTTVPCAPCVHSQKCPQKSHLCAEDVTVDKVFAAVWDQLVAETAKAKDVLRIFERATWTVYLDNKSEGDAYIRAMKQILENATAEEVRSHVSEWKSATETYQQWILKARSALPSREELLSKRQFQAADISDLILLAQDVLKSGKDNAGYFQSLVEALLSRFTLPVQMYDRIQNALVEVQELVLIRETLTEYLQTLSMEGAYYAKGIGQLSIDSFAEAGKSLQRNLEDAEL